MKKKLHVGETVYGTMITACLSTEMPPMLAAAGLDFFIVDTEHSAASYGQIEGLARVGRACGIAPLIRVTDNEYHLIARTLDCGALGVVAPRIHSTAAARNVVDAVKFAPEGSRGYGLRGMLTEYAGLPVAENMAKQNAETAVIVQVESGEAIEELPNTVRVAGIDAIMVGPNDLSISLGVAGQFDHPKFQTALKRIAEVCAPSPVAAGIHFGDAKRVAAARDMGYRFLIYSTDMALMVGSLRQQIGSLRKSAVSAKETVY